MLCIKCDRQMQEHSVRTLEGLVTIDKCTGCGGIWFDTGEEVKLKNDWMSEFLDDGNRKAGVYYNNFTDVECPRCNKKLDHKRDSEQHHIAYEVCSEHGIFMDAGEFTDYKNETLLDIFKVLISRILH